MEGEVITAETAEETGTETVYYSFDGIEQYLKNIDGNVSELRSEIVTVQETAYKECFITYSGIVVVLAALGIIAGLQAVSFFKGD